MNKKKLLLLFLFTSWSLAQARDLEKKMYVDQLEREYLIHLPTHYSSGKKFPVVFAFHGGGGNYQNTVSLYNFNTVADKNDCIVVYPNALNKSWSMKGIGSRVRGNRQDIDDVKFISTLMDTLVHYYHADSNAFFCTGISRGGIFSLFLADKLSNRIKAIAPVCASIPQSIAGKYSFHHPTPVLLINGREDPLIPFNGGHGSFSKKDSGEEEDFLPTYTLVKKISALNKCNGDSIVYHFPNVESIDLCKAVKTAYTCNSIRFIFIEIIKGGHTWPGGKQYLPKALIGNVCNDFKAEEEIVKFFMSVR
ncbi:MAG TPA: alpha/beta hydrolase-fold protein [Cytophagaceae bacterium]|jgi:polyhydroxybutyrate depolymerase|nr:alpha/beta hydrolase-fold protein [Cytophagaceae bacterium]